MVHRLIHRVGSADTLDFWADRLGGEGLSTRRENGSLVFSDPEGLEHELAVFDVPDAPLIAHAAEVPDEHALQGFEAVRAYHSNPAASATLLEALEFEPLGEAEWTARGEQRGGRIVYDQSTERGVQGAGTVHHVAWSVGMDEQDEWREKALAGGARPTPIIDRFWFRSIYFREPSGVLFELATRGPGFTADEPQETLGEALTLPPDYEKYRERLQEVLTPLPDPRQWRRSGSPAG
jgi:glyoxalase family protein